MDENQKINCSVDSCIYNDTDDEKCTLKSITVAPVDDIDTKEPDESMCASYEYDESDDEETTPSVNNTTWEQK